MGKTRVLALDQATSTGWATGSDLQALTHGVWRMPRRHEPHERLGWLLERIEEKIGEVKPDLIAYEAPWHPQPEQLTSSWATIQWAQKIEAVCLIAAHRAALPIQSVASATWRKTVCGFGRAPKGSTADFMKKAVLNRMRQLGYTVSGHDEGDALGIAMHFLVGAPAMERIQGDLLEQAKGMI